LTLTVSSSPFWISTMGALSGEDAPPPTDALP
jgi:hypothetical protein